MLASPGKTDMPNRYALLLAAALAAPSLPAAAQDSVAAAVPPATSASLTVTVDPVRKERMAATVSGTGLVVPWQESTISATTNGVALTEILVKEGDHVAANQVIARLDDAMIAAEIGEKQAAIASAEASFETAASSNARGRRLTKTGALSAETAEERETAVKTAAAALAQAKATLQTLILQRDRTVIRAPFAGVISSRPATLGITMQTGTEIAKIQRDGVLRAAIDVPEQYLARLKAGDAADVTGPSGPAIPGTIADIAETVDAATHLARVEIALPAESGLKAGMFVRGTIAAGGSEAMTVAESALTWRDGKTAVFVVADDNDVALRPVTASERRDGRVAVTGDLAEGQRVVTAGAGFLNDGNSVRVVSEQASVAAGEGAGGGATR